MILYGITLVPLVEDLIVAYPGLLSLFYTNDLVFDGSARRIAQLLNMLMERGPDRVYFPKPDKFLFISYTPAQEEAVKRGFSLEGLPLNFVSGSRYLGVYLVLQEKLKAWVKPQVDAWAHGVRVLDKYPNSIPSRLTPSWKCRCNSNGSTCKGLSLELAL